MSRRVATLVLALIASGYSAVFAQQDTATIVGYVADSSGALVPNATVTVTNVATGISVTTATNERGEYTAPSLRPGEYAITAEAGGFRKITRTGVTLQVAQVLRLDMALQPGDVSEAVEVTAAVSLLQTETSSRGSSSINARSSTCRSTAATTTSSRFSHPVFCPARHGWRASTSRAC